MNDGASTHSGQIALFLALLITSVFSWRTMRYLKKRETHRRSLVQGRAREIARVRWIVVMVEFVRFAKHYVDGWQAVTITPVGGSRFDWTTLYFRPEHPSIGRVKKLVKGDVLEFAFSEQPIVAKVHDEEGNYIEIKHVLTVRPYRPSI